VFLVDRLSGDSQLSGDFLPGPAPGSGVAHLHGLELFEELAQGGYRMKSHSRILVSRGGGELHRFGHNVNLG
jgi:hypothetical protein